MCSCVRRLTSLKKKKKKLPFFFLPLSVWGHTPTDPESVCFAGLFVGLVFSFVFAGVNHQSSEIP